MTTRTATHTSATTAALLSAMALTCAPGASLAQESAAAYPSRPVTIISPNAPGGSLEMDGRFWGQKLSESLGKPFVLDFKPGGTGTIGTNYVARATPDGYTLGVISAAFTVSAVMLKDLPYDPIKDFAPVSMLLTRPALLIATATHPFNNYEEYIAFARTHPGKINYGTTGAGGIHHIIGAWMHSATNTKVTFVHYKGTGPQTVDLLAGRGHVAVASVAVAMPNIKAGKTKPIVVLSAQRTPLVPGVKTVAEQGIPDYDYSTWAGFLMAAAVPPAIVNKLGAEIGRLAKDPKVIAQLAASGTIAVGSSPAEFRQHLVTEINRWRKIAQDNDIKADGA
jgi:tripartite-type tricarboxylate transporter receptor subunit TctC